MGNFVRAVDIKWDDYIKEKYYSERFTLDLRDPNNCNKVTKNIDLVFHLAANMGGIGFITKVGADILHDNALMNINMLEFSVKNNVERFFYSSSACVYPEELQITPNVNPLKESDAYPAHPDTYYGWEKLFGEILCEAFKKDYGLDVRIARFHNIYGPECTYKGGREKAPAAICRKIAEQPDNGRIEIWGDGKQTRSFCYIDDCVEAIIMLMNSNFDKPLNIGSDRLVTIEELVDIVIKISGKKIKKYYNLDAPQGVRGRNADLTLVKKVLNWEPKISLEKGLERTYKWIEQQINKRKVIL
jgi:nucleoside-diphosphate-sugar epimerase